MIAAMNELLPLYDATEMRALDAAAIGLGIPAAVLMERAGLGAAHEVMSRFPIDSGSRSSLNRPTAGTGSSWPVTCWPRGWSWRCCSRSGDEAQPQSRGNLEVAERLGVPVHRRPSQAQLRRTLRGAEVVIDALFGTGFGARRGRQRRR